MSRSMGKSLTSVVYLSRWHAICLSVWLRGTPGRLFTCHPCRSAPHSDGWAEWAGRERDRGRVGDRVWGDRSIEWYTATLHRQAPVAGFQHGSCRWVIIDVKAPRGLARLIFTPTYMYTCKLLQTQVQQHVNTLYWTKANILVLDRNGMEPSRYIIHSKRLTP